jgi:hypothetical protein
MSPSACPILSRLEVVAYRPLRRTPQQDFLAWAECARTWDACELAREITLDEAAQQEYAAAQAAEDVALWLAGGSLDVESNEREPEVFQEAA